VLVVAKLADDGQGLEDACQGDPTTFYENG
jgi:hypothetical protein